MWCIVMLMKCNEMVITPMKPCRKIFRSGRAPTSLRWCGIGWNIIGLDPQIFRGRVHWCALMLGIDSYHVLVTPPLIGFLDIFLTIFMRNRKPPQLVIGRPYTTYMVRCFDLAPPNVTTFGTKANTDMVFASQSPHNAPQDSCGTSRSDPWLLDFV